jgi:plasmid stabilization system protein ParE
LRDRRRIWSYIAEHHIAAAARLDRRFAQAVTNLEAHPLMGYKGFVHNTRYLTPAPNYRIQYEQEDDVCWILGVFHTSMGRW